MSDNPGGPVDFGSEGGLTGRRFAVLMAALIFGLFPDVVLGIRTFAFRDFGSFGYPAAHFFRESILRGEAPLWNPLNNCGLPFLAQWSTMAAYPGALVFLLGPLTWLVPMFCLGHLWLGGVGMFCLAERWTGNKTAASVAGVVFAFNGFTLNALMWPNYSASLGWMPWVLLLTERAWESGGRWSLLAAAAGAMQMLAGPPEVVLITWILVGALWVRDWWHAGFGLAHLHRASAVIGLVSGLAAIQLLPFFQLLRHSQRNLDFGTSDFAMPGTGWANLLIPLFDSVKTPAGLYLQPYQGFTSSYYPGAGALLLALLALAWIRDGRAWLLGGLAAFSLAGAMGDNGVVFPVLRKVLPFIGLMRFPIKLIILLMPCVALLAALGVARLQSQGTELDRSRWRLPVRLFAGLVVTIGGLLWFEHLFPGTLTPWSVVAANAAGRLAFAGALLGLLFLTTRLRGGRASVLLGICIPAVVWLDFATHMPSQNPTVPSAVHRMDLSAQRGLVPPPGMGGPRVMLRPDVFLKLYYNISASVANTYLGRRFGLYMNCNLLEDIPKIDGFYSLYLSHEDVLRRRLESGLDAPAGLLDFLGIGHICLLQRAPSSGAETSSGDTRLDWEARRSWMPLVSAGQRPVLLDDASTLDRLFRADLDLRREVFLPPDLVGRVGAAGSSPVEIGGSRVGARRIEATVSSSQTALVVIAQGWYPGWKASVDGRSVPLWRANLAFQALEIPAGRHEVKLVFEDVYFTVGALISLVTFMCVLAGLRVAFAVGEKRR